MALFEDGSVGAQAYVAQALALLEAEFRALALLALADWERLDLAEPELFAAVGALQRPSWGTWNFLLQSLRNGRKAQLRGGRAAVREAIEGARTLQAVLAQLDQSCPDNLREAARPLVEWLGGKSHLKRIADVLTLPIALRNQVAHFPPADDPGWAAIRSALAPLVRWHAEHPMTTLTESREWPEPWFLAANGDIWAFNGADKDFTVSYASPTSNRRRSEPTKASQLVRSLQRLLGKVDIQEQSFYRLLSRLAPEEIRGVVLGDFLVGSPVGSGGFASVHIGRQLSTGRRVAIKILHDGLAEDARLRFQQEAAFLSRIAHPAVVGVVSYGEDAWSVPRFVDLKDERWFQTLARGAAVKTYIALEWIDGDTLEGLFQKIYVEKTMERPSLPVLRHWFRQSAEAIAAVHGSGLIHRDIKPSNLMVTSDEQAIRLMDFGVARSEDENRTLMTSTGAALGTPPYMSPEQIRAHDADAEVGPASDVYSLCATFYELCTGTRVFEHDTEPLERVKTQKLRGELPVPPHDLVNGMPWELETILIGGLAPEIADRYQTAEALARDLARWESDQPIEYRRPSLVRRARLVYRRHRTISNLVAAFITILAAATAFYVRNVQAQRQRADEQRTRAVKSRADAEELIGFMLVDLRDKLIPLGRLDVLDAAAQKAVKYYDGRQEELSDDELAKRALARRNLGDVLKLQGDSESALRQYRASLAVTEALCAKEGSNPERQRDLAASEIEVGNLLSARADTAGALAAYQVALAADEKVVAADPTNAVWQRGLTVSHNWVGLALRAQGDATGALAHFRASYAIRAALAVKEPSNADRQRDLSISDEDIGGVLLAQGDTAGALVEYRASLAIREKLAADDPGNADWQHNVSLSHEHLGDVFLAQADTPGALAEYKASLVILETLAANDPTSAERQLALSIGHDRVGDALLAEGETDRAAAEYRAALSIRQSLAAKDPKNAAWQRDLALSHNLLGRPALAEGNTQAALAEQRAALAVDEALAAKEPTNADVQSALSFSKFAVANVLLAQGNTSGALELHRASLAIREGLAKADPTNADRQRDCAFSHEKIGDVLVAEGAQVDALTEYRAALAIRENLAAKDSTNAARQHELSASKQGIGDVLLVQGNVSEALAEYRAALAIEETLVETHPSNLDEQRNLSTSHNELGDALLAQDDNAGAITQYRAALAIDTKLAARDPTSAERKRELSVSHSDLGEALLADGETREAIMEYRAAVAIDATLASKDPTNADEQRDLSVSLSGLGDALLQHRDWAAALIEYRKALAIDQRLAANDPANVERQHDVAVSLRQVGDALLAQGNRAGALASYRTGLAIAQQIQPKDPTNADLRELLSTLTTSVGTCCEGKQHEQ